MCLQISGHMALLLKDVILRYLVNGRSKSVLETGRSFMFHRKLHSTRNLIDKSSQDTSLKTLTLIAWPKQPLPRTSPGMRSEGLNMRCAPETPRTDSERHMSLREHDGDPTQLDPGDLSILQLRLYRKKREKARGLYTQWSDNCTGKFCCEVKSCHIFLIDRTYSRSHGFRLGPTLLNCYIYHSLYALWQYFSTIVLWHLESLLWSSAVLLQNA